MNTSQQKSFLSEIADGDQIPLGKRSYFRERLRNRLYSFVLGKFAIAEQHNGLTKAELARRLDRRPEVITRLLGSPGNWTLDTVSDLLLGISAEELDLGSTSLTSQSPRNYRIPDWLSMAPMKGEVKNATDSYGSNCDDASVAEALKPSYSSETQIYQQKRDGMLSALRTPDDLYGASMYDSGQGSRQRSTAGSQHGKSHAVAMKVQDQR